MAKWVARFEMFIVLLMKIPVLLYYPEDKGKKFLLKVGTHVPVWMVTYPRRWIVWYIV
jgi:hypothetical protein